ncbi:DUF6431 domain-containing protein [Lachnospiraceae bacterium 46-15]
MVIIKNYKLVWDGKKNIVQFCDGKAPVCPLCSAFLKPRDRRKRIVKQYGGKFVYVYIRRSKCEACGKLHNELPDFLIPYKHYASEVVENVVDGAVTSEDLLAEDYPCEETMKRWKHWVQRMIERVRKNLKCKAREGTGKDVLGSVLQLTAGWLPIVLQIVYNLSKTMSAANIHQVHALSLCLHTV